MVVGAHSGVASTGDNVNGSAAVFEVAAQPDAFDNHGIGDQAVDVTAPDGVTGTITGTADPMEVAVKTLPGDVGEVMEVEDPHAGLAMALDPSDSSEKRLRPAFGGRLEDPEEASLGPADNDYDSDMGDVEDSLDDSGRMSLASYREWGNKDAGRDEEWSENDRADEHRNDFPDDSFSIPSRQSGASANTAEGFGDEDSMINGGNDDDDHEVVSAGDAMRTKEIDMADESQSLDLTSDVVDKPMTDPQINSVEPAVQESWQASDASARDECKTPKAGLATAEKSDFNTFDAANDDVSPLLLRSQPSAQVSASTVVKTSDVVGLVRFGEEVCTITKQHALR